MISVVIPTIDRADRLALTLDALRQQQGPAFEVIVVHGPSRDHTAEVVARYADVRLVENPERNVAASRNLGIASAAGDRIAFLDDDAIPEPNWLADLTAALDEPGVAGVGGLVLDHTGTAFQSRYLAVTRLGRTLGRADHPYDAQCFPWSYCVPYLPGGNALFRRAALEEVGGYDEVYAYYHDDTDIAVRLADRGYLLRQIAGGVIHHHFAPSAIRNPERTITDVFPIVKSATYFTFRHGGPYAEADELLTTSDLVRNHFAVLASHGADATRAGQIVTRSHDAWQAGRAAADAPPTTRTFADRARPAPVPFRTTPLAPPVVVIGSGSAADEPAARALSASRLVRLLVTDGRDVVELDGTLWVHHLPDSPQAVVTELRRIAEWLDDAVVAAAGDGSHPDVRAALREHAIGTGGIEAPDIDASLPEGYDVLGVLTRSGTRR